VHDSPPSAHAELDLAAPRGIFVVRGGLALLAGVLLLVWPDRTLLLIGVVLGVYLVVFGIVETIRALSSPGLLTMERVVPATLGLLAVAAGTIAISRPDASVRAVAIAVGVYLVVVGLDAGVNAIREPGARGARAALAVVDLAAGLIVLVWPDVTVTVVAVVLGIALVLRGAAEILLGAYVARARH
jgi:uncharacterized membrane protein HdeD (DUF308 family)